MARTIIVLEQRPIDTNANDFKLALWLTTPTNMIGRPSPVKSAVPDITQEEQDALDSGVVTEQVVQTGTVFDDAFQQAIADKYAGAQSDLDNNAPANNYLGASFDATLKTWSSLPAVAAAAPAQVAKP